jgi:drug/metabolite transporter (DMT)-like permease
VLGAVYLLWGATFTAVGVAVEALPPMLMSGTRFLVAGLLGAVVMAALRGLHVLRLTRRQLAGTCAAATCMIPGANALVVLGQQSVPSGLAAVLGAVAPCFIVLLRLAHGDRVRLGTAAGVGLGLVGVTLLLAPAGTGAAGPAGPLLVLGGSALWALGAFYVPRLSLQPDVLASAATQMIIGGGIGILVGVAAGERPPAGGVPAEAWWGFAYLVVLGSLVGFAAYTWLLVHASVSTASTTSYGIPLVAVVLGIVLLDESLSLRAVIGGAAVVAACVVVVTAERAVGRGAVDATEAEASGAVGGSAVARDGRR